MTSSPKPRLTIKSSITTISNPSKKEVQTHTKASKKRIKDKKDY